VILCKTKPPVEKRETWIELDIGVRVFEDFVCGHEIRLTEWD
jgi:hypothetical protein